MAAQLSLSWNSEKETTTHEWSNYRNASTSIYLIIIFFLGSSPTKPKANKLSLRCRKLLNKINLKTKYKQDTNKNAQPDLFFVWGNKCECANRSFVLMPADTKIYCTQSNLDLMALTCPQTEVYKGFANFLLTATWKPTNTHSDNL